MVLHKIGTDDSGRNLLIIEPSSPTADIRNRTICLTAGRVFPVRRPDDERHKRPAQAGEDIEPRTRGFIGRNPNGCREGVCGRRTDSTGERVGVSVAEQGPRSELIAQGVVDPCLPTVPFGTKMVDDLRHNWMVVARESRSRSPQWARDIM